MIRRPLGRGLDALIESTQAVQSPEPVQAARADASITAVPIDRIAASPFQPRRRFDSERLQELARAIESQGVIEPLVVRPTSGGDGDGSYELIAGERRLRAARLAGLSAVPVIVRDLDDRGALEMSLVENLAREDLSPIEEGESFIRLSREFGLSHEEIARRIGKSRPHVSNTIRLLELPPAVIEMIVRRDLSAGQARPLLALSSAEKQLSAARRIAGDGISARGAEEIASTARRRAGGSAPRSNSDPNLAALAEGIQRALKRKVRIVKRRGKSPGRIEIDYYDDDDLTALAATLSGAAHTSSARL
jgi:ParB family transcriptional regulator, chromosome partitioning protein